MHRFMNGINLLVMGPAQSLCFLEGPGPARSPARSLTYEEGPKPRLGPHLSIGEGPENMSILFNTFEGPLKARA